MTEQTTEQMDERECAGTTQAGEPCGAPGRLVDPDTGFCVNHDPDLPDQPGGGRNPKDKLGDPAVPDPEERRFRIERLYMAVTMSHHPHGSKAWLARNIGVRPKTVRRWTWPEEREDARTPRPGTWKQVEEMEEAAGKEALSRAEELLRNYYRENPESSQDWEQFD